MNKLELLEQIKLQIDDANKIAIFGHENIDGDSIGGML
jgi:nanoRNase/pAp phosphatase (c-di-AMP/oligoRNAs hydrolase)